MKSKKNLRFLTLGLLAVAVPAAFLGKAVASDHADTPEIAASAGTDISDVFIFPSKTNPNNVVLAMMVHPLITPAQAGSTSFDPNVLYQFKVDNNGDAVEDLVIQARFSGSGPTQKCLISGPVAPVMTGTSSTALPPLPIVGTINKAFTPRTGTTVFCGVREDPFFFDLEQFFTILPDRATPVSGVNVPVDQADVPQATSWRAPGQAVDFLSNGGYNVLAIVVEIPKADIGGASGQIGMWCTTSVPQ
ncbi:MAG: DUF4331 family protein [Armatimonadetes bacterium]|nr:DUF4331 family protein [Armatimonadota bacterium]